MARQCSPPPCISGRASFTSLPTRSPCLGSARWRSPAASWRKRSSHGSCLRDEIGDRANRVDLTTAQWRTIGRWHPPESQAADADAGWVAERLNAPDLKSPDSREVEVG